MNSVSLIGTLDTDPALELHGPDRPPCSFRLAVVRPSGAGADVIRIVVCDRQAEHCARVVSAGQWIAVDGRLRSRTWDDGGERRTSLEVVAESVSLVRQPTRAAA